MTFSERLMDMRKERGYTQYSLAEAVGVSVDSIRRWENGKQEPRLGELQMLARVLGVSVGVLVGEEERIVIQRGGMRLELPDTPEGRSLAEARLALRGMGFNREQITPHGFRAMFSTWTNERNYPPDVIEACLAHQDRNTIRAAYNRAEYLEQRRELLQKWADWLEDPQ